MEIEKILSSNAKIMAVVKADAYGHGDAMVAKHLWQSGVRHFGVSNLDEAISIRRTVAEAMILIFGATPPEAISLLSEYDCVQSVYSLEFAKEISQKAVLENLNIRCHLKLDTGMGRLGLLAKEPEECVKEAKEILELPGLSFEGIFTHFACADELSEEATRFTKQQFAFFQNICQRLENEGYELGIKHVCNSAGTLCFPEMHLDMVRPGIILYGIAPSAELENKIPLKAVMTLKSAVAMVKELPKKSPISYGRTYITEKSSTVATLPLGYADGYERVLSGKAHLLLKGEKVPVIGRICMDQLMVDVTGLDVKAGDEAIIFGDAEKGDISASEIAKWAGTIPYEIVCILGKRVPRVYFKGGTQIAVTRYKYMKY